MSRLMRPQARAAPKSVEKETGTGRRRDPSRRVMPRLTFARGCTAEAINQAFTVPRITLYLFCCLNRF